MLAFLFLAAAFPVNAQTNSCSRFLGNWEIAEKEKSRLTAAEIGDESVARATMRAIQINNELQHQSIILQQMIAQKCQLPNDPPSVVKYLNAALRCVRMRLNPNSQKADTEAACDMSNWRPGV
jgi:translation initiation factor 2 beta subunit (eIF-2beta)/eIF-5